MARDLIGSDSNGRVAGPSDNVFAVRQDEILQPVENVTRAEPVGICRSLLDDVGEKLVAAARQRREVTRIASVVLQRFAQRGDRLTQAGVADVRVGPQLFEKLLAGDQPPSVLDEI